MFEDTTENFLNSITQNQELKAVLDSQWGDYGLPAHLSSLFIHVLINQHYIKGAYYPIGGSQVFGTQIKNILENRGSQLRTRHEVLKILSKNNTAIGVEILDRTSGQNYQAFAPHIVSNAGAQNTLTQLLDWPEEKKRFYIKEISNMGEPYTCVVLYVGLKNHPSSFQVSGENYWIYTDYDHKKLWNERDKLKEGKPGLAFVSFGSANDPQHLGGHTAQIIAPCSRHLFEAWADGEKGKRPAEYYDLKQKISQSLVDFVDKHIPGFRSQVEFFELGTPLSFQHYTSHPSGQIYGIPMTPARLKSHWLGTKTPMSGLYLCGADATTLGIGGVASSGLMCNAAMFGWRAIPKIFSIK